MPLSIFAYSSYSFIAGFDLCQITSAQDLNPRPCADNAHKSVLVHEMMVIEPGENPTRTLIWKPMDFLSHIKCRTNDDRLPLPLWENWFCSSVVNIT